MENACVDIMPLQYPEYRDEDGAGRYNSKPETGLEVGLGQAVRCVWIRTKC